MESIFCYKMQSKMHPSLSKSTLKTKYHSIQLYRHDKYIALPLHGQLSSWLHPAAGSFCHFARCILPQKSYIFPDHAHFLTLCTEPVDFNHQCTRWAVQATAQMILPLIILDCTPNKTKFLHFTPFKWIAPLTILSSFTLLLSFFHQFHFNCKY